MGDTEMALHPTRPIEWKPQSLSTQDLLDTLRRNHLAMNRSDSPYWQAEQKIRDLLETIDMIAALVYRQADPNDVMTTEVSRLVERANK